QRLQPVPLVGELVDQVGHSSSRVRRQAGGRDAQRQRQSSAELGELGGGVRFGGRFAGGPGLVEQFDGGVGGQRFQRQHPSTAAHRQAGQPAPAGHQHHRFRVPRQQRVDLLGVAGVVEQHQHPAAGQQGPVQRGPVVQ